MTDQQSNTILIIGGPNAGKTHFGGQLYGRLQTKQSHYRITSPPEDLTIFKDVLDNLNDGKSAGHTNVTAHEQLEIKIEDNKGAKAVFSFPDYGGEQIKSIVNDRRINKIWKEQVERSDAWMLFIRLDEILPIEDVVNRGLPEQDVISKRNNATESIILSAPAFYIELMQILLFTKKVATKTKTDIPKLTVVLSCWDLIENGKPDLLPDNLLREKLPALHSFITGTWEANAFQVIGLSSTGKSLSDKEPDMDFVKKGPESFGYIITPDGEKQLDLTLSIATFIGTNG